MFYVRQVTCVKRAFCKEKKTRLPERVLNVRFEKNYFNAWVNALGF